MYKIPAIPKRLLKDDATIKTMIDNRGIKTFEEEEIKNVRFQTDNKMIIEGNRYVKVNNNIMFVDVKNSVYSNVDIFKEDSIVIHNNIKYVITSVEYIDDDRGLHHLEITLL